jgi:DNA polymerase III alpha subunit (gram-positive type)
MLDNLLRYKKNQKYVFFDYETEGLNLYSSKPFQLSFITSEGQDIIEKADYYMDWPDLKIPKEVQALTHLNWEEFRAKKKNGKEVLKHFEKYLYDPDYLIVGHNIANYDIYIHNIHRRLTGFKTDYSYVDRIVDTLCLAKSLKYGIPKSESDCLYQWQCRLSTERRRNIKVSQKAMLKDLGIDFDDNKLHNSLYDVEKCKEMFFKLIWSVEV